MRKKRFLQRLTAAFLTFAMAFSTPTTAFAEGEIDLFDASFTENVTVPEISETDSFNLPEISETPMTEFSENGVMLAADGDGIQQMTTQDRKSVV